eukprot:CAMPEP_0171283720 /NCGR_PEP_ID=MMETSP0790-20130122/67577_1 /TAXON_ID=2925 /ORGANISM="Alexandrium catenella, Strain OF101" /LENGTH=540 /DNA_ID=CAMNT_0011753011 /DNA_START=1 /DNA_END=1621 /DNA_ORIENTATION=-
MTSASSKGAQKARSAPGPVSSPSRSDGGQSNSPKRKPRASASTPNLTLEEESELRQFLKLVRGVEWGCKHRKHGHNDVSRVIEKLKAIGVSDLSELFRRVSSRRINEELSEAGYPRFSKDTLESIRKQSSFIRALENLNEANYRQVGALSPAPQMLSSENLVYRAQQNSSGLKASLSSARPPPDSSNGSPLKRRPEDTGSCSVPGLSTSVSSAFLHMCSEDAPTEDGLTYMPLHLRGARQKRAGRGMSSSHVSNQALAASLPELSRPASLVPAQIRLTPDGNAQPRSLSQNLSPSNAESDRQVPGQRLRVLSAGNISTAASEPSPLARHSPLASCIQPEGASPNRSRSVSFKAATPGLDTPRLMDKLMRTSTQIVHEQRAARWTSLNHNSDSLLHHGEAMLKEQYALEARQNLFKEMESEGVTSPLRQHIARKIRGRLREEQERDGQGTLDQVEIQQRSINIRKHLGLMYNLRRELQVLKRNAFDDDDDGRSKNDSDGAFLRGAGKRTTEYVARIGPGDQPQGRGHLKGTCGPTDALLRL